MCSKLPGPRCSGHSLARYQKAKAKYEELLAQSEGKRRNLSPIQQAQQKMEEARREYNASPKGLKELDANIAIARKERKRGMLDDLIWQREVALADAQEHHVAEKIYQASDRTGVSLRHPEQDRELMEAYAAERSAAAFLAEALNSRAGAEVIKSAREKAMRAKENRLIQEHRFLRSGSGIEDGIKKSVPVSDVEVNDSTALYTYLPPSEFRKVSEYFPLGAYARVVNVTKDDAGNCILHLEGGGEKLVAPQKKLLAVCQ